MFCLIADVEIQRATANRKGLQDALGAISLPQERRSIPNPNYRPFFTWGDQATGTIVLSDLYQRWKDTPVNVNLDQLWGESGMRHGACGIELDSNTPLAEIRSAITSRPSHWRQSQ